MTILVHLYVFGVTESESGHFQGYLKITVCLSYGKHFWPFDQWSKVIWRSNRSSTSQPGISTGFLYSSVHQIHFVTYTVTKNYFLLKRFMQEILLAFCYFSHIFFKHLTKLCHHILISPRYLRFISFISSVSFTKWLKVSRGASDWYCNPTFWRSPIHLTVFIVWT